MVRVKRRYFVFQFHFDTTSNNPSTIQSIKSSTIYQTFETMIARLYGDHGVARFIRNLSIIYYNPSTHLCIVRCIRDDKHLLQTTATFITRLGDPSIQCSLQTIHVSGSIRQCKKYLINYSIEQLLQMDRMADDNATSMTLPILFKKKKNKKDSHQVKKLLTNIDQQKQIALQKLLADSRIESMTTIESKEDV